MKNNQAKLIEGNIPGQLVRLTLPMFVGILGMISFNLIDTFFVGRLGAKELAAMSFTFPVVMIIGSISMGLGIGASSVISRAIGEGAHRKVVRLTTDGLLLALLTVIVFVTAGLFTLEPLFTALGADAELLPLIESYMKIWYLGVPFVIIPMVGNNAIRATGDTKTPSAIMFVAIVVNSVLDPLLIFGIGPFPRMELEGAALATVIARAVTLIVAFWVLWKREKMLSLAIPKITQVFNSWKKILYVGVSAAGTNLIIPISIGIITRLVSAHGNEAVAGFGVASRIEAFSLTIMMALGSVMAPFAGQNLGAGKIGRIRTALKLGRGFSMVWG